MASFLSLGPFRLFVLLVLIAAPGGCFFPGSDPFDGRVIQARNESGVPVIFGVDENGEFRRLPQSGPTADGQTFDIFRARGPDSAIADGCTTLDVLALGPNGEELARATPPLCYDDPQPALVVNPSEEGQSP